MTAESGATGPHPVDLRSTGTGCEGALALLPPAPAHELPAHELPAHDRCGWP